MDNENILSSPLHVYQLTDLLRSTSASAGKSSENRDALDGLPDPFDDDLDAVLRQALESAVIPSQYGFLYAHAGNYWYGFIDAILRWYPMPEDLRDSVMHAFCSVANTGLTVDDFQDGTRVRKGQPTAAVLYGPTWVMMCCCIDLAASTLKLRLASANHKACHPTQSIIEIYWRSVFGLEMGAGQLMEITFIDQPPITMEDYMIFSITKFSGVGVSPVIIATKLSGLVLPEAFAMTALSQFLATATNEYVALFSPQYKLKKNEEAEDISLGIYTYAILKCLETQEGRDIFLPILRMKTKDREILRYAVGRMLEMGLDAEIERDFERARQTVKREIAKMPPNPRARAIVAAVDKHGDTPNMVDFETNYEKAAL